MEVIYFLPGIGLRFFDSPEDQLDFLDSCHLERSLFPTHPRVFLAVGSVTKWKDWIDKLIQHHHKATREDAPRFGFLVDMANGDTTACIDTVEYIRTQLPGVNIMAGNVATISGYNHLADAGANFIRVGIGGGSICSTRINTGYGVPTFESLRRICPCKRPGVYVVADGGHERCGDIVKAMAIGADMVMLGKMFASTDLSPGRKYSGSFFLASKINAVLTLLESIPALGKFLDKTVGAICRRIVPAGSDIAWVEYRGMASKEAQEGFGSKSKSVEGVSGLIPYSGTTEDVFNGICANLRSAMAYYGGCVSWRELQRSSKFLQVTHQGWIESGTRVENMT